MKILLIDTCGATGSVALADTERVPVVVAVASLPGRTASEQLVATIKDLTSRSDISLQSLDAVVVVHGPGSFTGVRVGVSAGKGLCEALGIPLIAISRLAVLAHLADAEPGTHVYTLLDAGRGEFYVGEYVEGICRREALLTLDEFRIAIDHRGANTVEAVVTTGEKQADVVATCETSVAEYIGELHPQVLPEPTAEDALPLALRRVQSFDVDDSATLDANYLRRTDAEIFAKPRVGAASVHQAATPAR